MNQPADLGGSVTRYGSGKRPGGKRNEIRIREKTGREAEVRAHPGPSVSGHGDYGVIRKLHPRRAATRGVRLGRLRSYERRGSARQTGLRPCVRSGSFSKREERMHRLWALALWVLAAKQADRWAGFRVACWGRRERHADWGGRSPRSFGGPGSRVVARPRWRRDTADATRRPSGMTAAGQAADPHRAGGPTTPAPAPSFRERRQTHIHMHIHI
jgi:hypothetical protein